MRNLTGKTALVTGGGQGIGRGIAMQLAAAGATVIITHRREKTDREKAESVKQEIRQLGIDALSVAVDLSDSLIMKSTVSVLIQADG